MCLHVLNVFVFISVYLRVSECVSLCMCVYAIHMYIHMLTDGSNTDGLLPYCIVVIRQLGKEYHLHREGSGEHCH